MRRLVNNWLYGETSVLLTGRLDTDVYSAGCSRLENMYVHRQGGISRRPPLKVLRYKTAHRMNYPFTRMIPFNISSGQSYILYLSPQREGTIPSTYTSDIYIDNGVNVLGFTTYFLEEPFATKYRTTWGALSIDELWEVRYAVYYDSLYLVHKNCPLLRIRSISSSTFSIEFPEVKVNQSVKRYNISLSISNYSSGHTGTYNIYVAGKMHSFSRTSTMNLDAFLDSICAITYKDWKATKIQNGVLFEPDRKVDKYVEFRLATSSSTQEELANADFKLVTTGTPEFSYAFTATEDTDDTGLVYGQDDFLDMELNTQYNYASNIAVASERLWLVVNSSPCRIYVSRPYGTSQLVYPKESNDTILDFIQYQVVTTTSTVMKEESELPVKISKDSNGNVVYTGTSQNQRMWAYSTDIINTKSDYDNALELRECTVVMGDAPDYEGGPEYRRVLSVTAKDESFTISWSIYSHITRDTEVDYSKLSLVSGERGEYYSTRYKHYENNNLVDTYVVDAGDADEHGLRYHYFKTSDIYPDPTKKYFSDQGAEYIVTNPTYNDMDDYYERDVVFSSNYASVLYEKSGEYIDSNSYVISVEYDPVNARILSMYLGSRTYCEAIPYYNFDLSTDSDVYEESTQVDKVATSSTGLELQFATGRNDYIKWIGLGDYIMVGTESSEHRLDYGINALEMRQDKYSDYGSLKSLVTNVGRDMIFLSKGNKLRLLYKDYYGLQNIELTLTNQEIMEGEILNMVGILDPEPAVAILKRVGKLVDDSIVYTYSIVFCSVDRTNGVQAFARWTFDFSILDICVNEKDGVERLVVLADDNGKRFTAYFDFNEKETFSDCGRVTGTTTIEDNKYSYNSIMKALPFDTQTQDGSITLGEAKNVSKIVFRCLDTGKIVTWYNEKDKNTTRTPICCDRDGNYIGGLADHAINVNGGTTRDLMIAVEAYEDEPMTLLAMAYELRVNRNG